MDETYDGEVPEWIGYARREILKAKKLKIH